MMVDIKLWAKWKQPHTGNQKRRVNYERGGGKDGPLRGQEGGWHQC